MAYKEYRKGAPKPGEPGYWTPESLKRFTDQPTLKGETAYEKAIRLQREGVISRGGVRGAGEPTPSSLRAGLAIRQQELAKHAAREAAARRAAEQRARETEARIKQERITRERQAGERREVAISKREKVARAVKELAVGETGERFIGISVKPRIGLRGAVPDITARQIKTKLQERGLPSKVVAEVIPTTPLGVGVTAGAFAIFPHLPAIVHVPVGGLITGVGIKGALDVEKAPEQRIASGIIGGLAGAGTIITAVPFVKGAAARISPKFKPVKVQPEGFKAVTGIPKTERIGLIEAGAPAKTGVTKGVTLPKTSPLKRGGFGVRPSEKIQFIGREQTIATSQRGFFKPGKDISLKKEFFVTPQEPTLKIPETRISRLGLIEPTKFPKQVQIDFGLPKQPQIGIMKGAAVGRVETPAQFIIGKGTELEAIKTAGTITGVQKLGVTTIRGQAVDIFKFRIGRGVPTKAPAPTRITTEGIPRVSGELVIGVTGAARGITRPKVTTKITTISPTRISGFPTRPTRPPTRPTRPITRISPPTTIRTPPITPPSIPPTFPTTTKAPPSRPPTLPPTIKTPPMIPSSFPPIRPPPLFGRRAPSRKMPRALFGVEVRRRGKFIPVGRGTLQQAITIGTGRVGRTLAATFRITPLTKGIQTGSIRTPIGFRKPRRGKRTLAEPFIFIEKRGQRLSHVGETIEIQIAKRRRR